MAHVLRKISDISTGLQLIADHVPDAYVYTEQNSIYVEFEKERVLDEIKTRFLVERGWIPYPNRKGWSILI